MSGWDGEPPAFEHDLLPVAGASRVARDAVTGICASRDLPHLVMPATLVVGELVGNVVDHAHTMMTLRISPYRSSLCLAVQDGSAEPPVLRRGEPMSEQRGRGLLLVEALSSAWGYRLEEGGKTVWAIVGDHPAAG